MMAVEERAGLGERYGVAVGASKLELEEGRDQALDIVAAMGYVRLELAAANDEAERIAGELGPLLWRGAYGRDREAVLLACEYFAAWLLLKPYFAEIEAIDPGITHRFAACAIEEWMSRRCKACGGSGYQEVSATGKRLRPSGRARNVPKAICVHCKGSGRPKPVPRLRLRALTAPARKDAPPPRHIPTIEYRLLWQRQFVLASRWLHEIATMPRAHLVAARYGGATK